MLSEGHRWDSAQPFWGCARRPRGPPSALGQDVSSQALVAETIAVPQGTKSWIFLVTSSLASALCHLHHSLSYAVPQLLLLPCRLETPISLPHLALTLAVRHSLTSVHPHTLLLDTQRHGLTSDSFSMSSGNGFCCCRKYNGCHRMEDTSSPDSDGHHTLTMPTPIQEWGQGPRHLSSVGNPSSESRNPNSGKRKPKTLHCWEGKCWLKPWDH